MGACRAGRAANVQLACPCVWAHEALWMLPGTHCVMGNGPPHATEHCGDAGVSRGVKDALSGKRSSACMARYSGGKWKT